MSVELEKRLPELPVSAAIEGMRTLAQLLESIADVAQKTPEGSVWMRNNLPAIESIIEHADALHGAARRCRHAMRPHSKG